MGGGDISVVVRIRLSLSPTAPPPKAYHLAIWEKANDRLVCGKGVVERARELR
jgi:hypothetical protein